ncbi:MAG: hypothetical protein HUU35_16450 [Armatimonadetes bacterium]|nr:hypothetical protein [Armatimonadota bacterium]
MAVSNERAAAGQQSLRVGDAQGLQRVWEPHFYYEPRFREGLATCRFDLLAEPGSEPWIEWRSGGYPYQVGPSLKIDAQDRLVANGKVLATVPRNQWLSLEVVCPLGGRANGRYDLVLSIEGAVQRFPALSCDQDFKRLQWLGFVALADRPTAYFLDNVTLMLGR